ncbi:1,4-alpha-glucan branching protein GlgB [Salinisphaera sp.]|uniref:1,4-alpha-glucan branching protein GlgB n=1 Tax=Salinisphaera sp. TaxID=1914330 RepID=UPI002D797DD2|nr:1,4-alpha-glucan branching protein GlgB [Salinisphaera sp.]HET7314781.1 1,4-alpha-glucan branching protein GlgB [Salinisphaera sp.]
MTTKPTLNREHIRALVAARHGDPFSVLGPQSYRAGETILRALLPEAEHVAAVDPETGATLAELARIHDDGLFEGVLADAGANPRYRLRVTWGGHTVDIDDPYRFAPIIGDYDLWLLAEGTHHRPFECLGAHPTAIDAVAGVRFAVWAPGARRVSVVGDFNHWDGRRHPMRLRHGAGVWELFVPGVAIGALYQYEIVGAGGELLPLKADPYGFAAELRPARASVVAELPPPAPPLSADRRAANAREAPITVYEVHLGSWARSNQGADQYLTYAEIAERLVPYVRDLGFTHVELLPVSEYPFDGSWGYQPVGLYAPTSRFGTPADFRALIEACHDAGLGVILDWVPAHFPADAHGLARFDGTHLYEHADPRQGFHRDWNTLIFNYGRNEVCNYLIGNALYWLERFGVDGLRVDAVASMLYLDYSREADDWVPNIHGGNENLEAISFLRELNHIVGTERPGAIMIAEESTAWPGVTRPPHDGGLGFHYKWNLGWMNDSLEYMRRDPAHRGHHQNEITFSLVYAFDENFILPLSHDEVVHGKGSILARMPGDDWQRFANLRAYYGFMFTHPGKKLLFMGDEFAQPDEWNHTRGLDWAAAETPPHGAVRALVAELNACYRDTPALHGADCAHDGFRWIDHSDHAQSVFAFVRQTRAADDVAVCVFNFTPVVRHGYRIGVPAAAGYRETLNTDAQRFGGSGVANEAPIATIEQAAHGFEQSIALTLPPLAALILQPV